MTIRRWVPLSFFLLVVAPAAAFALSNDDCLACHGQGLPDIPSVDAQGIAHSVHGKLQCIACHSDIKDLPHQEKPSPVSCRSCHRLEAEIYLQSDHGKALSRGVSEAASCFSCHGRAHAVLSSRDPKSPVFRANLPKTCAACHADLDRMKGVRLTEREPYETYVHSVHGEAQRKGKVNAAVCSDCHGTHDLHGPSNPASKIYRANIPTTCGKCHENVVAVYRLSVHGKAMAAGIKEAPVCTDCHGEHTIRAVSDPASSVNAGTITKTCAVCHDSTKIIAKFGLPSNRLSSYQNSYHGLAARLGDMRAANCASCHGWHDVLPSSDPRSSVNPGNLNQTCGKCHSGAQVKLLKGGSVHGGNNSSTHPIIRVVKLFYLFLIPLLIGFMVLHNLSDYIRKAFAGETADDVPLLERELLRMNRNERWQHGFLLVAFTTLAVSGFALKFPDSWWALPFASGGETWRRIIHRGAAIVFVLSAIWHILYMVSTSRGRFILRVRLWPKISDALDPVRTLLYNVGLRRSRPHLKYPSYIERMEYWALVWGSLVMIVSGSLLVFNDFTLKNFPLWVSNLATMIHFYEAVLACLAIVVWHFYWTIFDPHVYPMNWAWLFGRMRMKKRKNERKRISKE